MPALRMELFDQRRERYLEQTWQKGSEEGPWVESDVRLEMAVAYEAWKRLLSSEEVRMCSYQRMER